LLASGRPSVVFFLPISRAHLGLPSFPTRRSSDLGELAGNAPYLDHGLGCAMGQHHRHLQEDAEEITDVVGAVLGEALGAVAALEDRKSTRLNSSHVKISYAVFCLKKKRQSR